MGLVDEVEIFLSNHESLNNSAKSSIGYRQTISWLQNTTTEDVLSHEISETTIKLVKTTENMVKKQLLIDKRILLS
jgi:tRNA A37 N6-isopentenylltransferase MiaA